MSTWHWFVLIIAIAAPFVLIYWIVRSAARSGAKAALKKPPPDGGN